MLRTSGGHPNVVHLLQAFRCAWGLRTQCSFCSNLEGTRAELGSYASQLAPSSVVTVLSQSHTYSGVSASPPPQEQHRAGVHGLRVHRQVPLI
jgi:hypothetical protein